MRLSYAPAALVWTMGDDGVRDGVNCSFRLEGDPCPAMPERSAPIDGALVSGIMKPMPSRRDIESARQRMLRARQALEDYENANGCATTSEHIRLSLAFKKATQNYLKLSRTQR